MIAKGWVRVTMFCIVYLNILLLVAMFMVTGQSPYVSIITNVFISVGMVIFFRLFIDARSVKSLGMQWQTGNAITGLLLAPLMLGVGCLLLALLNVLQWTGCSFNPTDFFSAIILMILVAIGEEMVFRGYILNNLMQSMSFRAALLITSVLFALIHSGNAGVTPLAFVNLFLGGMIIGLNYIYTRNLSFAILFHFSWNFFQGPVLGYDVSGVELQSVLQLQLTGNDLFTGGLFGFEGSIADTIVSVITLVVLYLIYQKHYGSEKLIS
ncbi:MAG: CPBP family intramembrane metalloprotease [Chitinophagaceae bacterium]